MANKNLLVSGQFIRYDLVSPTVFPTSENLVLFFFRAAPTMSDPPFLFRCN